MTATGRRPSPSAGVQPRSAPADLLPRAFVEGTTALVSIADSQGVLLLANPALQRFTGLPAAELIGRFFWDVYVVPEEVAHAQGAVAHSMTTGEDFAHEGDWLAEGGRRRRVSMLVNVLRDGAGRPCAVACIGLDVTEQREREEQLRARTRTDVLTGLGNRSALFDSLARYLDPVEGPGAGVLFCDLDGFKAVNDEHGHALGDQVLVEVSARLRELAHPGDVVARFGGDEFVVLRPGGDPGPLADLAAAIEDRMGEPIPSPVGPLHLGISIGSAVGRPGDDLDEVIARADRGMYGNKTRRRPRGRTAAGAA